MIETAVILARGLGTRMRADGAGVLSEEQARAAAVGHKALMPIGRHRLIDYSLSALADAGISRAILVVAPEHAEFEEHFASVKPQRLDIDLVVQQEPLGTANAVASAEQAVAGESFIMANGDNLYPGGAIRALREAPSNALIGFDRSALVEHSNIPADRIAAFALVDSEQGKLRSILEKPSADVVAEHGPHGKVSMNLFAFTPEIFDACRKVEKSERGEYEIVDALNHLPSVDVLEFSGGVLDLSRREDVEQVERLVADIEVSL